MTVRLDSKFSEQTNTCEFRKAVNLAYGQGGLKLEINIPPQHILAKSKGGLIIEGGVSSSEYGIILSGDVAMFPGLLPIFCTLDCEINLGVEYNYRACGGKLTR